MWAFIGVYSTLHDEIFPWENFTHLICGRVHLQLHMYSNIIIEKIEYGRHSEWNRKSNGNFGEPLLTNFRDEHCDGNKKLKKIK